MAAEGRPHLRALTGLRFVAAFQVLAYHGLGAGPQSAWWMRALVGSGYVGVSLFFVLSGFVLTYTYHDSLRDGTATRGAFLAARVARIYPVYLLSLLVALPPLFWLVASKDVRMQYGWLAGLAGMYAGLLQAWDPRRACVLNCPAWSLSDEAFFYLAFLFVLPLVARWGLRRLSVAAAATYALALLVPVLYLVLRPDGAVPATPDARVSQAYWLAVVKYNPLIRLPEFVMGVIAGRLFLLEGGGARRWHVWLEAGAVGVLAAVLLASPAIPYPLMHNGLLAPAFAALVYALARGVGPVSRVLATRALVRLGAASFALYILHVPLLAWMSRGYKTFGVALPPQPWHFVIFAAGSIGVSLVVFDVVEEPGRRVLRRLLVRRRAEVPVPVGARGKDAGERVEGRELVSREGGRPEGI
jgi:peptidoglycan/LPS O-acetylase OafA/YrhL